MTILPRLCLQQGSSRPRYMHAGGGGPSHSAACFVLHGGHAADSPLFSAYATSGLIAGLKQITQCATENRCLHAQGLRLCASCLSRQIPQCCPNTAQRRISTGIKRAFIRVKMDSKWRTPCEGRHCFHAALATGCACVGRHSCADVGSALPSSAVEVASPLGAARQSMSLLLSWQVPLPAPAAS